MTDVIDGTQLRLAALQQQVRTAGRATGAAIDRLVVLRESAAAYMAEGQDAIRPTGRWRRA